MEFNSKFVWIAIAVIIFIVLGMRIFVLKNKDDNSFLNKLEILVYLVLITVFCIAGLIFFLGLNSSNVQTKKQKGVGEDEKTSPEAFSLEKKKDKSNPLYSVIDSVKNLFYYLKGDLKRTKNLKGETILVERLEDTLYRDITNHDDYYTCTTGGCVPEYDYGVINAVDPSIRNNLFLR